MAGDPRASTMHDEALQKYINMASPPESDAEDFQVSNDSVRRIARSHQNVNAKLEQAQAELMNAQGQVAGYRERFAAIRMFADVPEN